MGLQPAVRANKVASPARRLDLHLSNDENRHTADCITTALDSCY
jgi:hypothetical protein